MIRYSWSIMWDIPTFIVYKNSSCQNRNCFIIGSAGWLNTRLSLFLCNALLDFKPFEAFSLIFCKTKKIFWKNSNNIVSFTYLFFYSVLFLELQWIYENQLINGHYLCYLVLNYTLEETWAFSISSISFPLELVNLCFMIKAVELRFTSLLWSPYAYREWPPAVWDTLKANSK